MLFSGTSIVQALPEHGSNLVTALVVRTAFSTLRGQLIRHILYPKPNKLRFTRDSLIYLCILFLVTLLGYFSVLPHLMQIDAPVDRFTKFLDLIAISVPPLLIAALQIGIEVSIYRLEKVDIQCISPPKVI
jgi:magnesium-transporting ATPase (P-type)